MSKLYKGLMTKTKLALYAARIACIVSTGSFFEIFPHTFLIEKYRTMLAKYKREQEVPLTPYLEQLIDSVFHDLEMENDRNLFKPFTIAGFDVYHAGFTKKYGTIIGIPHHFSYREKRFVETYDIRIGYKKEILNPYHPATDDLIESLVLSDKAKKYAVAREILMSTKNIPFFRAIESPIIISSTIWVANILRQQFVLSPKPMPFVVISYLGLGCMTFATWFQIRDTLNTFYERRIDKKLSELGKGYIEGGTEFYDKVLKRNIATRKLVGKKAVKIFNADGDEILFIRMKTLPLTHRKKFFEELTVAQDQPQAA